MSFLRRPQAVWWRRALFQVHLWVGLFVALYAIVIGLTGSILVFKEELAGLCYPALMKAPHPDRPERAGLPAVMEQAGRAWPGFRVAGGYLPGVGSQNILVYLEGSGGRELFVMADASDGHLLGTLDLNRTWLHWLSELHINLLLGIPGFVLNAIGGALLLVLSLSGLALWWPGVKRWTHALRVDFRRGWRRINFDLHSAGGLYTLAFVVMWSVSGIYFVFPKQVAAVVSVFSPVEMPPEPKAEGADPRRPAPLGGLLEQAIRTLPGRRLAGVYLGPDGRSPITVFMARGDRGDFSQMDSVYFHPTTGRQLEVWRGGGPRTAGTALVSWLGPLHFGVYWGLAVKILWALLGLSLPALAVTGALMYWNRYLGRRWKRLRPARRPAFSKSL